MSYERKKVYTHNRSTPQESYSKQLATEESASLAIEYATAKRNGKDKSLARIRTQAVKKYEPLIKRVIYSTLAHIPYHYKNNNIEDFESAGKRAFLQALDRYDPSKGTFEPYACLRVRGSVIDTMRKFDVIPRNVRKIKKAHSRMEQELNTRISPEKFLEHIQWKTKPSLKYVKLALSYPTTAPITDFTTDDEGYYVFVESIPSRDHHIGYNLENQTSQDVALRIIESTLNNQQISVIELYFYEKLAQSTIGCLLGVSAGRVSQILSQSLQKLKDPQIQDMFKTEFFEQPQHRIRKKPYTSRNVHAHTRVGTPTYEELKRNIEDVSGDKIGGITRRLVRRFRTDINTFKKWLKEYDIQLPED